MDIQWITVEPGKVFIGSDNRSILFGGVGPRHEVKIDYDFEISYLPVDSETTEVLIKNDDYYVASESEWTLAMEKGLIYGNNGIEELSDKIRGSYWSKYCDGRSFIEDDWLMKVSRAWNSGVPKISLIPRGENSDCFRLVRRKGNIFKGYTSNWFIKCNCILLIINRWFQIDYCENSTRSRFSFL